MKLTLDREEGASTTTPSLLAASYPHQRRTLPARGNYLTLLDPVGSGLAQGAAGQELAEIIQESNRRLAELLIWVQALREPPAETDFPFMPPKRSVHMKVAIGTIRRGKPAPFALRDNDPE